jgi:hypothetical protein
MSLETNLRGRLRNTTLPTSHGLLPLFEAVVNSIHSIEDARLQSGQGKIIITLVRNNETQLELKELIESSIEEPNIITGFKISDNGVGFDEANMISFNTLDSDHKIVRGGRGVGRLLWLKAFRKVQITSIFGDTEKSRMIRTFSFDALSGIVAEPIEKAKTRSKRLTTVYLNDFVARYRNATYKTAAAIANSLLEHCLWYFVRPGGAPTIFINDNDISINLDSLYVTVHGVA